MKPTEPLPPHGSPKASARQAPPSHDDAIRVTARGDAHGGHHSHGADEMHNADVAHEHSDINVRSILMFLGGLVVVAVAVAVLMWGMFIGLERYAVSTDPQLSPVAQPGGQLPPEPRLLTNEPQQLQKTRDAEMKALHGYGWTDQAAGVAHMPIEEAKKLILQRGVPVRAGQPVNPRLGTNAPSMGESSGGRVLGPPAAPQGAIAPGPQQREHPMPPGGRGGH